MSIENPAEFGLSEVETVGSGQFLCESILGEGGGATVWKAKETGDPFRDVAVKILTGTAEVASVRKLLGDLAREARTWAEFQKSPHVVQMYYPFRNYIKRFGDDPFVAVGFVMEYAANRDLGRYLALGKPLRESLNLTEVGLIEFLLAITKGLKTGHDLGIVHRDIKPNNVLLFKEGRSWLPKLMDFGISAFLEDHSGTPLGTSEYMPPEILLDGAPPSLGTDIFSLGVLFYELVVGELPYPARPQKTASPKERREFFKNYWGSRPEFQKHWENRYAGQEQDEMYKLFSQMLYVPSQYRPASSRSDSVRPRITIAEVESRLERLLRQEVVTTHLVEAKETVSRDTYRWNPKVHEVLGEELRYYFVRGRSLRGDPTWIASNLRERGIRGFSIYRVLGGYDHIVRVWITKTNEDQIRQVFSNFNAYQNGSWKEFAVRRVHVLAGIEDKPINQEETELLRCIKTSHNLDKTIEFSALESQNLVYSHLETTAIDDVRFRVFLGVEATGKVSEFLRKWFIREVVESLRLPDLKLSDLSVYNGEGLFQFLIKFKIQELCHLTPIMGRYLDIAAQMQNEDAAFSSQTYVELVGTMGSGSLADKLSRSDDGSIVDQANAVLGENC